MPSFSISGPGTLPAIKEAMNHTQLYPDHPVVIVWNVLTDPLERSIYWYCGDPVQPHAKGGDRDVDTY